MKSRTIRALSIGGMLATVPAIAVISNTAGGSPVSASASSSSSPSSSPSSTPTSVATAGSTPTAAPVAVVGAPIAGSTTQFSYVAGDAATVILDSAGGTLRAVTFLPHPGWITVRLDQPTAAEFQVLLQSTNGQVRFTASVANGGIVANVEAAAGPGNTVPGGSVPGGSVPGNSTPDNSAPGNSGPDNTGPDNTGPDNTGPDNTGPGGDDNGGGNSGPGGGDDSGGDDSGGSGGGGSDD